ncbi:hypothetical protein HBI80_245770 [Parastagonospora nodorum]|nr:hypothetical protein HBI80_245770 [Parastagonospora nodorum]KAH5088984.1 hypothetical protein HBH72_236820 [Parastagonospora nodorum]KAH5098066.1 hypothetical protein HBH71_243940 [Parastagonospora nodorum]KAH6244402.1 hypothetical protein HBI41_249840 [Parastagonospora nodorum]
MEQGRATDPSDLSVQELKRLLGEKTEEKRSTTNILSPFSALSLNYHVLRTSIAVKRLLFSTQLEELYRLSRFRR